MTDEVSPWRVIRVTVVTAFLAAASSFDAAAQQGAEREAERDRREELTLEERVAALERAVASLDTRLDARTVGRSEDVPAPVSAEAHPSDAPVVHQTWASSADEMGLG